MQMLTENTLHCEGNYVKFKCYRNYNYNVREMITEIML